MSYRFIVVSALLGLGCDSPGGGGSCEFSPDSPLCQPGSSDDAATDAEVSPDPDIPDSTQPDTTEPDTTQPDTTQPDTTPTSRYHAVIVDDDGIFQNHRSDGADPCTTSQVGAHGADIDAVALFEADGETLVGYFDSVVARLGTTCTIAAAFRDPDQATGAPDGGLTSNYVSLGGGAIIGEFLDGVSLVSDDVLVVYEVGSRCAGNPSCGGIDERYHVWVADDLGCLDRVRSSCALNLTEGRDIRGERQVRLTGF